MNSSFSGAFSFGSAALSFPISFGDRDLAPAESRLSRIRRITIRIESRIDPKTAAACSKKTKRSKAKKP